MGGTIPILLEYAIKTEDVMKPVAATRGIPYTYQGKVGSGQHSRQPGQVREEAAVTGACWVARRLSHHMMKSLL